MGEVLLAKSSREPLFFFEGLPAVPPNYYRIYKMNIFGFLTFYSKLLTLNSILCKLPGVQETCLTDPMEVDATTSRNSSVSNVRNSLPDNGLEE